MRPLIFIATALAVGAGLRHAAQRLATHQPLVPALTSRINTQVHRINQH